LIYRRKNGASSPFGFNQNEGKILAPHSSAADHAAPIASEVMKELLRRRQKLEDGKVKTITVDELDADMGEAINEVRRSRH